MYETGLVITIVVRERCLYIGLAREPLRVYCGPTENQRGDPYQMESAMRRFIKNALVTGIVCAGMAATLAVRPIAAADTKDDSSVLQADHALVAAIGKADKAATDKFLDADFMWTNSAGETLSKAKVLSGLPKPPLGDESGIQVTEYTYGQVGEVRVGSGKMQVLRVWVKRPAGWRILHYHEVALAEHAGASALSANDCDNPCKDVPYPPKDDAEKGIRTSWAGLELALTDHDTKAWTPHFPDEYMMATSGATNRSQRRIALPQSASLAPLGSPCADPNGLPGNCASPSWRQCRRRNSFILGTRL